MGDEWEVLKLYRNLNENNKDHALKYLFTLGKTQEKLNNHGTDDTESGSSEPLL